MRLSFISTMALSMGLAGCGSLKFRDVQEQELAKIRTAAVVSFSVEQPQGKSITLNLGGGKSDGLGGDNLIPRKSPDVNGMYEDFVKAISQNTKWKMTSYSQLRSHSAYRQTYDSMMKGWQSKMPPNKDRLRYEVEDLMDSQSVLRMKVSDRDAFMKHLHVDAIIEARVDVQFASSGLRVAGIGPRYPQARVSFFVYKLGQEKPVWFDGNIEGEPSTESVGATNLFEDAEVSRFARPSALSAFSKIKPEMTKTRL